MEYTYYRTFEEYLEDFLDKMPRSSSVADRDYAVWVTCKTSASGVDVPDAVREAHPDALRLVLQHQFDKVEARNGVFSVVLWFSGEPTRVAIPLSAVLEVAVPAAGVRLIRL